MNKKSKLAARLLLISSLIGFTSCDNQLSTLQEMQEEGSRNQTSEETVQNDRPSYKTDSLALVAFYNSTNGEKWSTKNNWLKSGSELKSWYGVKTEIINGEERVVSLRLGGNKLSGELPKEIGNLNELKSLVLSDNYKLGGTIPEELYNLENLKIWKMRFTDIHGSLSPKIGNLVAIDTLDLWGAPWDLTQNNYIEKDESTLLTGEIPQEICNLKNARYIVLGRNKFSGEIPQEIGNLSNLTYLDIARCKLSGELPASIGKLNKLETLFVAGNELSGELPSEMGNMSSLKEFYGNENKFSGTIPSTLSNLKKLIRLSLSDNNYTGIIPTVLSEIESLGLLYLENNQFEGEIPSELGGEKQPHLVTVDLSNNKLTGNMPPKVAHQYIVDGVNYGVVYTTFNVEGNNIKQ